MGKKKQQQQQSWPEAIRRCRLNQDDVNMAKRLGFRPDGLIRAIPGQKDRWKLPVKQWIRELHLENFGNVLGEQVVPAPPPEIVEMDADEMRRWEEEFYWEDYYDRNAEDTPKKRKHAQAKAVTAPGAGSSSPSAS
jgi:hypothetical protein